MNVQKLYQTILDMVKTMDNITYHTRGIGLKKNPYVVTTYKETNLSHTPDIEHIYLYPIEDGLHVDFGTCSYDFTYEVLSRNTNLELLIEFSKLVLSHKISYEELDDISLYFYIETARYGHLDLDLTRINSIKQRVITNKRNNIINEILE